MYLFYNELPKVVEVVSSVAHLTCVHEPDINCEGTWSGCDALCDRAWTETQAQGGNGTACPQKPACSPGDGACPVVCGLSLSNIHTFWGHSFAVELSGAGVSAVASL